MEINNLDPDSINIFDPNLVPIPKHGYDVKMIRHSTSPYGCYQTNLLTVRDSLFFLLSLLLLYWKLLKVLRMKEGSNNKKKKKKNSNLLSSLHRSLSPSSACSSSRSSFLTVLASKSWIKCHIQSLPRILKIQSFTNRIIRSMVNQSFSMTKVN